MRTLPLASALAALMLAGGAGAAATTHDTSTVPIDPDTRVATVTETVTCVNAGDTMELTVEVAQPGPQDDTIWGVGTASVACQADGSTVELAVPVTGGKFRVGEAVATVRSSYCTTLEGDDFTTCFTGSSDGVVRMVMRQH